MAKSLKPWMGVRGGIVKVNMAVKLKSVTFGWKRFLQKFNRKPSNLKKIKKTTRSSPTVWVRSSMEKSSRMKSARSNTTSSWPWMTINASAWCQRYSMRLTWKPGRKCVKGSTWERSWVPDLPLWVKQPILAQTSHTMLSISSIPIHPQRFTKKFMVVDAYMSSRELTHRRT